MHDDSDILVQAPDHKELEDVLSPETELVEASEHVASNVELDALTSQASEEVDVGEESSEPQQVVSPEVREGTIDSMVAGIEALVFASGVVTIM